MSEYRVAFLNDQLSKHTSIFGLRMWVVLGICVGAAIVLVLFLVSLWFTSKRNNKQKSCHKPTIPNISKEIQEIRVDSKLNQAPNPNPLTKSDPFAVEEGSPVGSHQKKIHIEIGKDHRISYPERGGGGGGDGEGRSGDQGSCSIAAPEVSHLGWGHWYTLRELEVSTSGFAPENVIGEGGYGIVYRGLLQDNTLVAVKNLLNNRFNITFSLSFTFYQLICMFI